MIDGILLLLLFLGRPLHLLVAQIIKVYFKLLDLPFYEIDYFADELLIVGFQIISFLLCVIIVVFFTIVIIILLIFIIFIIVAILIIPRVSIVLIHGERILK